VTRLRGALVLVAVAIAVLSFDTLSVASQPAGVTPLDATAFVRIVPLSGGDVTLAAEPPAPILDFARGPGLIAERRVTPDASVRTIAKAPKSKPLPKTSRISGGAGGGSASSTGHAVRGTATWFCKPGTSVCTSGYPGGMYAAAGSELRIGNWRGRNVRVCTSSKCITVKLIDWCACGGARIIDLYSDAFRRLGSLNQGGLQVTVSW
jgi:hypothetical protein